MNPEGNRPEGLIRKAEEEEDIKQFTKIRKARRSRGNASHRDISDAVKIDAQPCSHHPAG
jgi:hypothetical protein